MRFTAHINGVSHVEPAIQSAFYHRYSTIYSAAVLATYLIHRLGRGLPTLSCSSILVMQTSQDRDGLDLPHGGDHASGLLTFGDLHRSPLAETLVGPRISEVADVLAEDAPQVSLAEDEDVIEALASDGSEEALADGAYQWRRVVRDFRRHTILKRSRCQRSRVSGWTRWRALRHARFPGAGRACAPPPAQSAAAS